MKKLTKTQERQIQEAQVTSFLTSRAEEERDRRDVLANRSLSLTLARQQLFMEQFKEMIKATFKGRLVASGYALKPKRRKTKRILNLLLSDLHIGARLEQKELPMEFGPEEESRRLAWVVQNAVEYKVDHREETELNVYLAGDMIEGLLMHEIRSGAPLVEQATAFLRHILQAILIFAAHFPRVRIYCQTGNHGRNKLIHPMRATNQKWDSNEGVVYHALATAIEVARIPNVSIEVPFTPYCAVPLFNHWAMITHGDIGPISFGNPGRSIDVHGIEKAISVMNATKIYTCSDVHCREKHGGHTWSLIAGGHVHTGAHVYLAGADVIINPALVPSGQYALALGYVGACGQRLWESVEGHPMGDSRLVKVGITQDKDASLDKIIQPFRLGDVKHKLHFPKGKFSP